MLLSISIYVALIEIRESFNLFMSFIKLFIILIYNIFFLAFQIIHVTSSVSQFVGTDRILRVNQIFYVF